MVQAINKPPNTNTYSINFEVKISTKAGLIPLRERVLRIETNTTLELVSQFRIVFTPEEDTNGQTVYDIVEPMSYVEISVSKTTLPNLTTVLRGFVTSINKSVDLSSGKPVRVIVVTGENYGKIIRWSYIFYGANLSPKQLGALATEFPAFAGYGIDMLTQDATPAHFVTDVFNKIVLPNFVLLKKILNSKASGLLSNQTNKQDSVIGGFYLAIDSDGVNGTRTGIDLVVNDPSAGAQNISMLELLNDFAGKPWNEMYIDERPDASYLVFRPTPWRDRDGNWVGNTAGINTVNVNSQNNTTLQTIPNISPDKIVALELTRSDEQTYNYYFTDCMFWFPDIPWELFTLSLAAKGNGSTYDPLYVAQGYADKLAFSRAELFGFRPLKIPFRYLAIKDPIRASEKYAGTDIEAFNKLLAQDGYMLSAGSLYNLILYNAMEHNSALEFGSAVISGDETIRPGMYIQMQPDRKDTKHFYYVTSVRHSIVPFDGLFTTTLELARGEGWINKNFTGEQNALINPPQVIVSDVGNTIGE